MSSKNRYIGSVLGLLLIVTALSGYNQFINERKEQHVSGKLNAADTSLAIEAADFSSHLPVVHITTGGQTIPGVPEPYQNPNLIETTYLQAGMQIFQQEENLNTLRQEPDIESQIQIRVRGNSSRKFDKSSYIFYFTDDSEVKQKFAVMGMESSSTWILHGPFLDKTLLRNYMWHNLSGKIMDWAPEVRFCEVFLDGLYRGVYVMMEPIEVGEGRLDLTRYDNRMPVSSYLVRMDRPSVNSDILVNNFTKYALRMEHILEIRYPGEKKITPETMDYISQDFSKFEKALYSYDYNSEQYGYPKYIDVNNFIDYFIINEVAQNSDAGALSTYIYKDIAGKYKLCVWDFNNCNDNFMEEEHSAEGFFMTERLWFEILLKDEQFVEQLIIRYRELRKDILSDASLESYMDEVQDYLGVAVERNFQVWGYTFLPEFDLLKDESRGITSYDHAISQYRTSLIERAGWLDEHIEGLRNYTHESINKKYNH